MKSQPVASDSSPWNADVSELYEQFAPMVRLAHLLTGSVAVAEDVVQDAFIRVAPRYSDAQNPRAYLRAAVVNGCRSQHRRKVREDSIRQLAANPEPSYDAPVVEFFDGLRALSDRQRGAIVLRYYLGLADNDIADLLGCAPATVRVLIRRALTSLRKAVTQ